MSLLQPGLDMLRGLTGRPTLGVLPYAHGLGIDEEDGLRVSLRGAVRESAVEPPHGEDVLRVAVAAVPLMSNFTDVDALAAEPGVVVRFVDRAEELADADLVVLPGTRGTVRALAWLRERGLADAIAAARRQGRPVLGICGGFQMLGRTHRRRGRVAGRHGAGPRAAAGPGPVRRARRRWPGRTARPGASRSTGTRSTTGWPKSAAGTRSSSTAAGSARCGARTGTARWRATASAGRSWPGSPRRRAGASCPRPDTRFEALREAQLERLADLIEEHADTEALLRLIEDGAPEGPALPAAGGAVTRPGPRPAGAPRPGSARRSPVPRSPPGGPPRPRSPQRRPANSEEPP